MHCHKKQHTTLSGAVCYQKCNAVDVELEVNVCKIIFTGKW